MNLYVRVLVGALIVVVESLAPTSVLADFEDFRALWVSRFEYSQSQGSGPSSVNTIMANAASMGITDVLFQVRGKSDAYYNSAFEPRAEGLGGTWDPLQTAIDAAHANGMKLHAWVNTVPLWRDTAQPANGSHPFFNTNPSFRVTDINGVQEDPVALGSLYAAANPIIPEVHTHINNVANDIATNYNVDGVHLDYIRWIQSATDFDKYPHDAQSHQLFFNETGLDGSNSANAVPYRNFLRDRITDLVGSLKTTVDAAEVSTGRTIDYSAAVWRDPIIAYNERLQDYDNWLQNDLLDIAMPMIYLSSSNDNLMQGNLNNINAISTNTKVAPGLGVYLHGSGSGGVNLTLTQLQRLYDNNMDGATFFSYNSFFNDPLGAARQSAVIDFYDNLNNPPGGDLNPDANVLVDFEIDEGTFDGSPFTSGSNINIDNGTTTERTTAEAHLGQYSQELFIDGVGSSDWFFRHLSGVGNPANNVEIATDGHVGFWLKTTDPGVSVAPVIDDPGTGERGLQKTILADGEWHLYEWDLGDNDDWQAWVTGNGTIDDPTTTLDSIQFFGTGDVTIYLDTIAHNPLGSLLAPVVLGDYDGNGFVDGNDYAEWQASFGQTVTTAGDGADGNANGIVDDADYAIWLSNLGSGTPPGTVEQSQVPEPSTVVLTLILALVGLLRRRENSAAWYIR